jgi:RNA polymerase sigma factor (sigma-70 family)
VTTRAIAMTDRAPDVAVALVERARTGDREAFENLIRPRIDRLLRLSLSIMDNEADARDAVQEACLRAWCELPRLREAHRFEAWLWQIAINGCRTALRSRRQANVRQIQLESAFPEQEPAQSGQPFTDRISATDAIRRAFRRLDPDKRTILVLHHVEERSIDEIAVLLSIPEGTAKWRLHAARQALSRALEAER